MRRQRRRPLHYSAQALHDGTVFAAFPVRKPTPKVIKRDNLKIDDEGVCIEWLGAGKELSNVQHENRFRFQNIIANRLNARRAIRELVLPGVAKLQVEVVALREQMTRIEQLLTELR